MKRFFLQSFQDKLGRASGRELTVFVFVCAAMVAWIGDQFLGFPLREYVFYGLLTVITAGLGFYTFERPTATPRLSPPSSGTAYDSAPPPPLPADTPQPPTPTRSNGFPTPNRYPR